jgi:GntR family transcriptional regulator, vanillate catabolism transcriptional regulator
LFHRQLIALADSFVVARMLGHIVALPFASPNAFVIAQWELGQEWKVFFAAQEHHRGIVEAIEQREGARAEALAREHARLSMRTLRALSKHSSTVHQGPDLKLHSSIIDRR